MSKFLTTEQREQSGSDSYNRFEYQVHWIVCHIVDQLDNNSECIVFCEYHDDMTELIPEKEEYLFYQIKTKEDSSDWTIAELSKKEKSKSGGYKKSFLGFIFYNFLKFGTECLRCYFVSNNDYDNDIRFWQSYIEDGKLVYNENTELYQKIKTRIKNEYTNDLPLDFDRVFDIFIQNTFVCKSELQLSTYETQTKGMFFEKISNMNIPISSANFIFQQLINNVRKKSKEKVRLPISRNALLEKKGIQVSQIKENLTAMSVEKENYADRHRLLMQLGIPNKDIRRIEDSWMKHDLRWSNVNDLKYQEIVITIRKVVASTINKHNTKLEINKFKEKCKQELEKNNLYSDSIDKSLFEVLLYEYRFTS